MWKRSDGFTLLEVLAALVVWIIIMTLLLPGLVRINQERNNFKLDRSARLLLTKEVEEARVVGGAFVGKEIERDGYSYLLYKTVEHSFPVICAKYEDYRGSEKKRCAYWNEAGE